MAASKKEYGLIKLQKPSNRLLAFASDSESEDENTKNKISISESSNQKRQAKILQLEAIKEDPTIFQYDEIYDDLTIKREEKKNENVSRQSKYISRLLVSAEKRKIEYEGRIERKFQKEREAEGDQFRNKEVFVTSAYREKLEKLKTAEEDAKREEYLESIGDVCQQKDLSGFYRHMFEQKTKSIEKDVPKINPRKALRVYRKFSNDSENTDEDIPNKIRLLNRNEATIKNKVHLQSNLDADSDFSIDSSDSEDQNTNQIVESENHKKHGNIKTKIETLETINKPEKKPSLLWEKRTIGDTYLAAVKRYFERKHQYYN